MTPELLSLLVWTPFLFLAAVFGTVFCVLGFKRGSIKAAISLGVTALTTLLSILLARVFAGMLASSLTSTIRNMLGADTALLEKEHFAALVTGCATALGALVLFIPCFMLLLLLFKNLTSLLFTKKIPAPKHVGNKLGGLAIGLADALVMCFILLLPLYGTLGLGGNLLSVVMAMDTPAEPKEALSLSVTLLGSSSESALPGNGFAPAPTPVPNEEDATAVDMLSAVCGTPLSKLATSPLFAGVYDSMASFTHDGETVSVTKTVSTATNVAGAFLSFKNQETGANDKMIAAFNDMEKLVTGSSFFAGLTCDLMADVIDEDTPILSDYEGLKDKNTLRGDLPAVFTLARSAVKNNILTELISEDVNLAGLELGTFPYDMADALNSTDSLAKWKATIVNDAIDSVLKSVASGSEDPDATVAGLKEILGTVSEAPLTGSDKQAEGDSLFLILNALTEMGEEGSSSKMLGDVIEGLARHPSFGVNTVTQVAETLLAESGMDTDVLSNLLGDTLNDIVSKPVGSGTSFGDFADAATNAADAIQNVANGNTDPASMEKLLKANAETLTQLKDTLTADLLASTGMDAATVAKVEKLFGSVFESMVAWKSTATDADVKAEAEALSFALSTLTGSDGKGGSQLTDVIPEPQKMLEAYLSSNILTDSLNKITENGEKDPLGVFSSLSKKAKNQMATLIQNTYTANVGTDASVADKLSDLATFLGIEVKLA